MAGLIVIDFIDMEQNSHVRKVEKAMKEALKNDRARIQVGRISSFGLMEMSRQRLRTGVLEASTKPCPHCEGTGLMRTAASAGLSALRIIEDEAARGRGERILLRAGREAAVYVLNKKRSELADIERRYGVTIEILIDESLEGARMSVDSSGPRPVAAPRPQAAPIEDDSDIEDDVAEDEIDEEEAEESRERDGDGDRQGRKRRRRRRGGRGRSRREGGDHEGGDRDNQSDVDEAGEATPPEAAGEAAEPESAADSDNEETRNDGRRPRRRRRGGRGGARAETGDAAIEPDSSPMIETPVEDETPIAETEAVEEAKPAPKRRSRKKAAPEAEVAVTEPAAPEAPPAETAEEPAPAKPARKRRTKKADAEAAAAADSTEPVAVPAANNDIAEEPAAEPRRGWWQKTFG
jgi:ribonuclease E